MSIAEKLLELGIRLRSYEPGNRYTTCPECSHTRKGHNQKKPCLSVAIGPTQLKTGGAVEADRAVFHCNHCEFKGGIGDGGSYKRGDSKATRGAWSKPGDRKPDGDAQFRRRRWW